MKRLILKSTSLAQWYTLVTEAEDFFGRRLETDLESYLVYLLEYYTNKPEITNSILALDYLESLDKPGRNREDKLRQVGDKCLIFCGFFPDLADKKHVSVTYFVELGRKAYEYLGYLHQQGVLSSKLYTLLRQHFVSLLDLLFSIRELSGERQALSLLQAEELWRNTGSQYAYNLLKTHNKKVIAPKNLNIYKIH